MQVRVASQVILFLLLLWGCASTQSFWIVTTSREPVIIPLRVDSIPGGGRAYATVMIGDTSFPMFIDIGSFTTLALKGTALDRVPVTVTGTRTFSDAFGTNFTMRNYIIPSCRIGTLTCADIHGTEMEPDSLQGETVAGSIGEAFFSHFNVVFDYPHHLLVLAQDTALPERYRNRHWITMPYYISNKNCITTDVTIDGKKRAFIWDTGASFSVIHPDVVGDTSGSKDLVVVDGVRMGGQAFNSLQFVTLLYVQPDADALMGHNFFLSHIILLNTMEHTLSIAD